MAGDKKIARSICQQLDAHVCYNWNIMARVERRFKIILSMISTENLVLSVPNRAYYDKLLSTHRPI